MTTKAWGEKTLREYSRDLHGHYARHAKAVLQKATGPVVAFPRCRSHHRELVGLLAG